MQIVQIDLVYNVKNTIADHENPLENCIKTIPIALVYQTITNDGEYTINILKTL